MSVTIEGVPASVPRERVLAFLRELGFEPNELVGLRVEPKGIVANVYADYDADRRGRLTGKDGDYRSARYLIDEDNVAVHEVCVPFRDEPTTDEKEPLTS